MQILVEGGLLVGGDGGDGTDDRFDIGYRGGDGIELDGDAPLLIRLRDEEIVAGQPGVNEDQTQGDPGLPLDAPAALIEFYPGVARSYTIGGPTREGTPVPVTYRGETGDRLWVVASWKADFLNLGARGNWLTGIPGAGPFYIGEVSDPSGELELEFPIADFGLTANQGFVLYEQLIVFTGVAPIILTSPSAHVIVDDSL